MDLLPTRHCFDDALDYIEQRVRRAPHLAHWSTLLLVHGIATGDDGTPYAHAWCEEDSRCWDAALANGERIWYAVARDEYYAARRIQHTTRYTIRAACQHNLASGHYGPWEPRYRALCGRDDRALGAVAADATGATLRTFDDDDR